MPIPASYPMLNPSKANLLRSHFSLSSSFFITANKSQGFTLDKVIFSLLQCDYKGDAITFEHVFVEIIRVRSSKDIRLLVSTNHTVDSLRSLTMKTQKITT